MIFPRIPFFRFTLWLISGILLSEYLSDCLHVASLFLIFFIISFAIIYFFKQKIRDFAYKTWAGIFACFIVFNFGIILVQLKNPRLQNSHINTIAEPILFYTGVIQTEVEEKPKTLKCYVLIDKIKTNSGWRNANGRILIYFFKNGLVDTPVYGNRYVFKGQPQLFSEPQNPGEFNLKKYYGYHGIYHRHFVSNKDLRLVRKESVNTFFELSYQIRAMADAVFTRYLSSKREREVASALILGIKNDLDDDIEKAYSSTGTMHVLAVSGLHVGIIYQLLVWLTGLLKRIKYGTYMQGILLLVLLWMYAFVTGLCPSVLRSVAMFSFVILGGILNRRSSVFNTMALSAFILLCYEPWMIMEVGFQLSYLAVAGIVWLQPYIYRWWETDHPVADWIWQITTVSLAAQLLTFPLGLLYFHQFPNYFILSNLVVIPMAMLIMYIGLFFVMVSWIPLVAIWSGYLVEKLVFLLNEIIIFFESLPFATIEGVIISVTQTWLLYAILLSLVLLFLLRKFNFVITAAGLSAIFFGQILSTLYQQKSQSNFIIYQVPKCSGIDIFIGQKSYTALDSVLANNPYKMRFHIINNRWLHGVKKYEQLTSRAKVNWGEIMVMNGITFALISKKTYHSDFDHKLMFDYVCIQNQSVNSLRSLSKMITGRNIIVDGSNKAWYCHKLKKEADELGVKIHFTNIDGAYQGPI